MAQAGQALVRSLIPAALFPDERGPVRGHPSEHQRDAGRELRLTVTARCPKEAAPVFICVVKTGGSEPRFFGEVFHRRCLPTEPQKHWVVASSIFSSLNSLGLAVSPVRSSRNALVSFAPLRDYRANDLKWKRGASAVVGI